MNCRDPLLLPPVMALNSGAERRLGTSARCAWAHDVPTRSYLGPCFQTSRRAWQRLWLGWKQVPSGRPMTGIFTPQASGPIALPLSWPICLSKSTVSWEKKMYAYIYGHLENCPLSRCRSRRRCRDHSRGTMEGVWCLLRASPCSQTIA